MSAMLARVTSVVVGAALVREGRLLVAQRSAPAHLAGRWELPGGKVEPGEDERAAVARECLEELGCVVTVAERVGEDQLTAGDRHVLRVYAGALASGSPAPKAHEHAELRWVSADELAALDWLEPDRPLIPALQRLLRGPVP